MRKPTWDNRDNAHVVFNTMKVDEAQSLRDSLHKDCNEVDRGRNMILVSTLTNNNEELRSKQLAEDIGNFLQAQIYSELNIYTKRIPKDTPGITLTMLQTAGSKVRFNFSITVTTFFL
jgi:hypothetical protein